MRQHPRLRPAIQLAAASLLAACGSSAGPTGATGPTGPLAVSVTATELRLLNRGDRPVYTFVAERGTLALINWAACADPALCPGLAPGASESIRLSRDNRLAPGEEAVVTWWYSVRTARGYEPDSLRSFVVRL